MNYRYRVPIENALIFQGCVQEESTLGLQMEVSMYFKVPGDSRKVFISESDFSLPR